MQWRTGSQRFGMLASLSPVPVDACRSSHYSSMCALRPKSSHLMKSIPQFSLRELLFVVLFAGLGLASLRAGGVVASCTVFLAIVVTMCLAIIAFVGRNTTQAFAIGFLIPVIAYGVAILAVGKSELDPYEGKLPTSKLLLPAFRVMAKQTWTNVLTGEVVPDYDPATDPNRVGAGGGGFAGSPMGLLESPDRPTFMSLGHILIATMFGYAGAKFAVIVHRKQRNVGPRCDEQTDEREPE